MLALMGCAVFAEWFQPGVILQAPSSFFARTDRTYREAPVNNQGQLLMLLFRLGTIAMMIFLCLCPAQHASMAAYGVIFGGLLVLLLVKMLLNLLIDYTFILTRRFGSFHEPYVDLVTMVSVLLYPALLVLVRLGIPSAAEWVAWGAAVLFFVLWAYRMARTYVVSLAAPIYLLMYFATVEVLPLAGLIYLSGKIMTLI